MATVSVILSLSLVLTNCSIVDVEHGGIQENRNLLIEGQFIKRATDGRKRLKGRPLDLKGAYVLPGLFNMHNNLSMVFPFKNTNLAESPAITVLRCYRRAHDALMAGITTLRTVGEQNRVDLYLKKMINEGWVKGPRIFAGGKGLGTVGGHGSDFGQIETKGPEEFGKAARRELARGADHLKIFITGGIAKQEEDFENPQMIKEEMAAVVSAARSRGTYVAAHAGSSLPIMKAVEAGVKCFEHGYVLNREAAQTIKNSNGYLVPTLSVTRSGDWMRENGFEEWTIKKALSAKKTHMESTKTAIRAGVTILNGTDLPPGDSDNEVNTTVREIEFLAEAGLSPLEALRAATIYPSALCGVSNKLGSVNEGYLADLVGVASNPLSDVRALEKIGFVMKDGEIFRNDLQ